MSDPIVAEAVVKDNLTTRVGGVREGASGRITRMVAAIRDRMGRTVCVGLNRIVHKEEERPLQGRGCGF